MVYIIYICVYYILKHDIDFLIFRRRPSFFDAGVRPSRLCMSLLFCSLKSFNSGSVPWGMKRYAAPMRPTLWCSKKNMFFDSFKVGEFLYVSMIVYVSPSQICWILRASGKLWSPSEYRSDGSVELRHFSWSSCWFSLTCSYLHWFPQCEDMWGPQDI